MKADDVKVGKFLNERVWQHGMKNPPSKVRVNAFKDPQGVVTVELFGKTLAKPVEEPKKTKKTVADKIKEKVTTTKETKKEEPKVSVKTEKPAEKEVPKTEVKSEKPAEPEKKAEPKPEVKETPKDAKPEPTPKKE
jgi:hypothetical protein